MAKARLIDHRKRQQAAHPGLTLTGKYNVLEALRESREVSAKDRVMHNERLVSVLRQLHDELDAAVLDAYSSTVLLPVPLPTVRRVSRRTSPWTRGQHERCTSAPKPACCRSRRSTAATPTPSAKKTHARTPDTASAAISGTKAQPWPRDTVDQIAAHFTSRGPWKNRLPQLIEMLLALGRAEANGEGYMGRR
ncbi:hypothetical protein [Aquimonas sp.]|uniref:hypothetical protein n=1 Tax=Aquimonas sp. TaxID=1872588 RepID=UPI0037C12BDD